MPGTSPGMTTGGRRWGDHDGRWERCTPAPAGRRSDCRSAPADRRSTFLCKPPSIRGLAATQCEEALWQFLIPSRRASAVSRACPEPVEGDGPPGNPLRFARSTGSRSGGYGRPRRRKGRPHSYPLRFGLSGRYPVPAAGGPPCRRGHLNERPGRRAPKTPACSTSNPNTANLKSRQRKASNAIPRPNKINR